MLDSKETEYDNDQVYKAYNENKQIFETNIPKLTTENNKYINTKENLESKLDFDLNVRKINFFFIIIFRL